MYLALSPISAQPLKAFPIIKVFWGDKMGMGFTQKVAAEKLNKIIQNHFGQHIQAEFKYLQAIDSVQNTSSYLMTVPLVYNQHLLGHVQLQGVHKLNQDQKNRIVELIQIILGPSVYNNFLENNVQNLDFINTSELNSYTDINPINEPIIDFKKNSAFYLKSNSESLIFKASQMMHEMSGNVGFLNLDILKHLQLNPILDHTMSTLYLTSDDRIAEFKKIQTHILKSSYSVLLLIGGLNPVVGLPLIDLDRIPNHSRYLEEVLEFFMFDFFTEQPLS